MVRVGRGLFPLVVFFSGLAALLAAAYLTFVPVHSRASVIGGPFALTDQDGRTVTDADFRGEPLVVFFGYTHCPDVCPATLFQISQIFDKLGPDKKVAGLFITVDP